MGWWALILWKRKKEEVIKAWERERERERERARNEISSLLLLSNNKENTILLLVHIISKVDLFLHETPFRWYNKNNNLLVILSRILCNSRPSTVVAHPSLQARVSENFYWKPSLLLFLLIIWYAFNYNIKDTM